MKTKFIVALLPLLLLAAISHAVPTLELQRKAISFAKNVPLATTTTVKTVGRALGRVSTDARTQALTIFCWMSQNLSYDMSSYKSHQVGGPMADQDPASVLRRRTGVCQGYADLFKAICDEIGLPCTVIVGYAKGDSYTPGAQFPGTNHAWNAIQIDGKWELIDVTWGDCLERNGIPDFFFFCPEPSQLLTSHLPLNQKWQLRDHPWSMATFVANPVASGKYFELGISGYSPKGIVIQRDGSPLEIKLLHDKASEFVFFAGFVPENSSKCAWVSTREELTTKGIKLTVDLEPTQSGTLYIHAGKNLKDQGPILQYQVIGTTGNPTAATE